LPGPSGERSENTDLDDPDGDTQDTLPGARQFRSFYFSRISETTATSSIDWRIYCQPSLDISSDGIADVARRAHLHPYVLYSSNRCSEEAETIFGLS
jgi:hypothetical protein